MQSTSFTRSLPPTITSSIICRQPPALICCCLECVDALFTSIVNCLSQPSLLVHVDIYLRFALPSFNSPCSLTRSIRSSTLSTPTLSPSLHSFHSQAPPVVCCDVQLTRAVRPTFRQAGQVRRFADVTSPDAPIAAAGVSTEPGTSATQQPQHTTTHTQHTSHSLTHLSPSLSPSLSTSEPRFWGILLVAFTVVPNLFYLRSARKHVEADQHNYAVTTGATQPNILVGQH